MLISKKRLVDSAFQSKIIAEIYCENLTATYMSLLKDGECEILMMTADLVINIKSPELQ